MIKELHIWLDTVPENIKIILTVNRVNKAIAKQERVIHTVITHFCKTEMISKYGYHIYLHPTENTLQEITLGKCVGTDKSIKESHNIEKLLYGNTFGNNIKKVEDFQMGFRNTKLEKAIEKLEVIELLQDGWENGQGKAFSKEQVEHVKELISQLTLIPSIIPTVDGAIQLEWENEYAYVEIEIYKDHLEVFFSTDKELEIEKSYNLIYSKEIISYLLEHFIIKAGEISKDQILEEFKNYEKK